MVENLCYFAGILVERLTNKVAGPLVYTRANMSNNLPVESQLNLTTEQSHDQKVSLHIKKFRLIMLNTFSVQMLSTCGRLFVWNILFFLFALPAEVNVEERHKSPQRFTGSIFPSLSNSHKTDWFNSIKNNQKAFKASRAQKSCLKVKI